MPAACQAILQLLCLVVVGLIAAQDVSHELLLKSASRVYIYDIASVIPADCLLDLPNQTLSPAQTNDHDSNEMKYAGNYFIVSNRLKRQLRSPNIKLATPETADLFVIDFDIDASYDAGMCRNTSHVQRLTLYIDTLLASPIYKTYHKRRRHLYITMSWRLMLPLERKYFPRRLRAQVGLHNRLIVGRYLASRVSTRHRIKNGYALAKQVVQDSLSDTGHSLYCVIPLPVVSPSSLYVENLDYETWKLRSTTVFFRDRSQLLYKQNSETASKLRHAALNLRKQQDRIIVDRRAATSEAFQAEMKSSKYCLVIRGDDPHTSRFIDSLSAGCVPVIINDLFHLITAPFATHINYAAFAIFIPEAKWLASTEAALKLFVLSETEEDQARRLAALAYYRDALLWSSPKSTTGLMTVHEALNTCR
eukprot:m.231261 g.231261  ORF g.231261 m.231261 type:complete len:420 (+) comp17364_c0_seq4:104-1363(+)